MTAKWIELITGSFEDKRRYRATKARFAALPTPYGTVADAVSRSLLHTGGGAEDQLIEMLEDLADLFEQSAAAGTPVRAVIGEDPIEFVEAFKRNYGLGNWLGGEQRRLLDAVDAAERDERAGS